MTIRPGYPYPYSYQFPYPNTYLDTSTYSDTGRVRIRIQVEYPGGANSHFQNVTSWHSLDVVGLGNWVEDLVAGQDAIVKELAVRIHKTGDHVSVFAFAKCDQMHLVHLVHFVQERLVAGPEFGVVPGASRP